MTSAAVVVAGHLCVDLAPGLDRTIPYVPGELVEVGPLRMSLGGSVANTGSVLGALGVPIRAYANVGNDTLGHVAASVLADAGIRGASLTTIDESATSYSVVIQPAGRDRSFWHHPGANAQFTGAEVRIDSSDLVLHVGYPPLLPAMVARDGAAMVALLTRARKAGVSTSVDLAVADPRSPVAGLNWDRIFGAALPLIDIFSPSLDDLQSLVGPSLADAGAAARWAVDGGAAIAMVSSGSGSVHLETGSAERLAHGGRALSGLGTDWADRSLQATPPELEHIATTNGAGDAASAGLIMAIVLGATPELALELLMGCAAARMTGHATTKTNVTAFAPGCREILGVTDG